MPSKKDLSPEIIEKLNLLQEKYSSVGQDLASYLDGLLYADFLTYWDYINLDTLLTLQRIFENISSHCPPCVSRTIYCDWSDEVSFTTSRKAALLTLLNPLKK